MRKRIIVKIGTKVLSKADGHIEEAVLEGLVAQIVDLRKEGAEVVLVTSGAVSCGRGFLKRSGKEETVADKQAFAAVGQIRLMETYAKLFQKNECTCAQVLVTKEDFRDGEHSENMDRCFLNLLQSNVIPVVNENDVVAIQELIFTDNDELAGLIAERLKADALIILTSVRGVLDGKPSDPNSKTIPEINHERILEAERHVTAEKTDIGRGGMLTKFAIAKRMMKLGITTYIAHGKDENILTHVVNGTAQCTKFIPLASKKTGILENSNHMNYQETLRQFISLNNVPAEFVTVDGSCHTVEDTARVLGVEPKQVVKNICLVDEREGLYVAILRGDTRLDKEKLKLILGVSKLSMATKEQVLKLTSYPAGGVPSFGYVATFVLDEKVKEMNFVYTGAGDDLALLKISVEALLAVNDAKIASIASD